MMQVPFIDLKAQYRSIQKEILTTLLDVLDGMELTLGPNVRAFESEFAAFCGARHALGLGSGTDALSLALRACGVGRGDEVITVAHSFFATAEAIVQSGAVPVFVDVDPETHTLDPARIVPAITQRTRAIVPVHLYGQMADMDPIMEVAQRHGLIVIEDACQAHGADYHGRRAGSIGDAGAFSFGVTSNLGAYGDAGAVVTNSHAIAEEVRLLRNHGSVRANEHHEIGVSSRLDEIQAGVLRVKLRHLDRWNERRRANAETYGRLLSGLPLRLPEVRAGSKHVFSSYVVEVKEGERDRVRTTLEDRGVRTEVHYPIPIHQQPAMRATGRIAGDLRVTESLCRRILSLPVFGELEPEQLAYVATCLEDCLVSLAFPARMPATA